MKIKHTLIQTITLTTPTLTFTTVTSLQICPFLQRLLSLHKFLTLPRRVCVCVHVHSLLLTFSQPQRGRDPVELLSVGCYVELQDSIDPSLAWAAEVEENVGGRLKLRLVGTNGLPDTPATLWLYYLHPRLHPPGWAKEHGCTLRPPSGQTWYSNWFLEIKDRKRTSRCLC